MNIFFIGVGSNLGDPFENCRNAVASLRSDPDLQKVTVSKYYRTLPVGQQHQPDFVNAVVKGITRVTVFDVFEKMHRIEDQFFRTREVKWEPRTLDLDILFFNHMVYQDEKLTIPHPEIPNRGFVLAPLMDLAPDWIHPACGDSIRNLYFKWQKRVQNPEEWIKPLQLLKKRDNSYL